MIKSGFPAVKLVILILFALAIGVHFIGLAQPFLGNFAQHQTDYATVVQRWLANSSIEPFNPVMRFIANGKNRLFYGDFPINTTLTAALSSLTKLPIEVTGRGLSAAFFFLSILPFYSLVKRIAKERSTVFFSLFFYISSPLSVIYGQAFLLEITALCFGIFGYYLFFEWLSKNDEAAILFLSGFFLSLMLITRIYFAPALIPLGLILLKKSRGKPRLCRKVLGFMIISIALPVMWQAYAVLTSNARSDESSLMDNFRVFVTSDPTLQLNRFNYRFYQPIVDTFLTKIITPAGLGIATIGLLTNHLRQPQSRLFFFVYLAAFAPLFVFATRKFVEFEYYFVPFIPLFAFYAGAGLTELKIRFSDNRWVAPALLALTLLFSLRFSIAPIRIIPEEDKNVLAAAKLVRDHTPADSRVIASHGSSTSFLYYTNRDGWAFYLPESTAKAVRNQEDSQGTSIERLERFRSHGAQYFALANKRDKSLNPVLFDYLNQNYRVVAENQNSMIYSLSTQS